MINPDRLRHEPPGWPTGLLTGRERRVPAGTEIAVPQEFYPVVILEGVAILKVVSPSVLVAGVASAGDLVGYGWSDDGMTDSPFAVFAETGCDTLVVQRSAGRTLEQTLERAVGRDRLKENAEYFSAMAEALVPYADSKPSRRLLAHLSALAQSEGERLGLANQVTAEEMAASIGVRVRTLRSMPYRALLDVMRVSAVARASSG